MKIEMHVHTSEGSPCANADARSIVKAYSQAGYDGIVITNHFDNNLLEDWGSCSAERIERYLLGYQKAKAMEVQHNINVWLGVEIRLEPGVEDYLIYGIDETFLFEHPDLCLMGQQQLYELCHKHNAVLYQAHPFREPCTPQNPFFLDGMEYNQRPNSGNNNCRLAKWIKDYSHLKIVSGSDCHDLTQVGFGGIITEKSVQNIRELVQLMANTQVQLIMNDECDNVYS